VTDAGDLAAAAAPDLTGWEDPPRVAQTNTAPVLSVDGITGPLDWLLDMARARKLDLARLSIAALIGQFAEALSLALADRAAPRIDHWAGWTVLAASLTELWSRLVLPVDPVAARAAAAEAAALRRRLLARARMRDAADWLARRPQLGRDVFPRGRPAASLAGRGSDITDLLRACLVALHVPEDQAAAYRPRPPPLWRVSDALPHLRRRLAGLPDATPLAALLPRLDGTDSSVALRAAGHKNGDGSGSLRATTGCRSSRPVSRWRALPCAHVPGDHRCCLAECRITGDASLGIVTVTRVGGRHGSGRG
jgi:segregation and condensation protein A